MAGVAPSRGGSNTTTIGMVVSIVVAVILAGLLIWLFTQQEQLRASAEAATAAKARLVKGNEENLARQVAPESGAAGKTIVGELVRSLQMMSGRMTGNQNDAPATALTKFDSALKKIASENKVPSVEKVGSAQGATAIVENLYQFYVSELEARQKAEADRDKALADAKAALDRNQEMEKNFGEQFAQLNSRVEELQAAKSEFERLKSADIESLQSQIMAKRDELDNVRKENSGARRRLIAELSHREQLLDEQKQALATLRGPGPQGAHELAVARNPVGKVMRALPGSALVGIDLGRRDHVVLGLTFTVYSAFAPVPSDGRGKALVEVVSVGERTSECRVISTPSPDDPILEGDLVGNIVLSRDRSKKQRFVVVGKFDVDFDGQPDPKGAESIKALVRRFGGEVVDRVDAMTDYVVVGTEPAAAEPVEEPLVPAEAADDDAAVDAKPEDDEPADDAEAGEDESDEEPAEESEDAEADESAEETPGEDEAPAEDESGDDEATAEEKAPAPEVKPQPVAPTIEKSPEVDVTAGPRMRRAMSDRQEYEEAIRRADKFAVPKLTADRFYNYVGLERGPIAERQLEQ